MMRTKSAIEIQGLHIVIISKVVVYCAVLYINNNTIRDIVVVSSEKI